MARRMNRRGILPDIHVGELEYLPIQRKAVIAGVDAICDDKLILGHAVVRHGLHSRLCLHPAELRPHEALAGVCAALGHLLNLSCEDSGALAGEDPAGQLRADLR